MLSQSLSLLAVLLGLRALYRIRWMKFCSKYAIFCGVISLGSLYYVRGRESKNTWSFEKLIKFAGYLIGPKPVVKGAHYLTSDKPCIYVAKHQNYINVTSIADVWPENCTIVAKGSLKFTGLSKRIYTDRSKHKDAVSMVKRTANEALKHKVSVYVSPEGTRICTDTLLPYKKDAFHLAIECQFPIQPIVISYPSFRNFKEKRFDYGTWSYALPE